MLTEKIGIAIELVEINKLRKIREFPESEIFAKQESIILNDKKGLLIKWKDECFNITDDQIKKRALNNYFRYSYLTDNYHFEKWNYRNSLIQITQNFNEAGECYCNFLYCINNSFIPRKDWLTYLTYDFDIKPEKNNYYLDNLYTSNLNKDDILKKYEIIKEIKYWMEKYCKSKKWIK